MERNDSDALAAVLEIWAATVGQFLPKPGLSGDFRIFPAGISEEATADDGTDIVREDWRIWWPIKPTANGETVWGGPLQIGCTMETKLWTALSLSKRRSQAMWLA